MNKAFSIYLDLVRFAAACLVYVYHSNQRLLVHDILPASNYGHSSVIVFFVLSGFVIAYVTDTKERDWPSYAASRISRVYSVALPAIALTLVLDALGRSFMPALYANYPSELQAVRAVTSALMLNEVWLVSITSLSNVPYWSICYETWYYAAFGVAMFMPHRWAAIGLALLALMLGPKIVLLAPIWLAGVLLYRWKRLERIGTSASVALLLVSVVGIVGFHVADVQGVCAEWLKGILGEQLHRELTFSKFFVSDYLLTLLVFANFVAMRRLAESSAALWSFVERPVRFVAGYTFTLYLLHQPLFLFWGAVLRGDPKGYGNWLAVTALTAASVLFVGHFTESRRHGLRTWLLARLRRIDQRFAAPTAAAR